MSPRILTTLLAGCALLAGCCHCPQPGANLAEDRPNPPNLLTLSQLVSAINANNQKIPTLWATLNYSATINDHGQVHSVTSDDGVLLYRHPADFHLKGNQALVGAVFDMGANQSQYWLEVLPGTNRMWWGNFADLAHVDLERLPIPIRPDLVMEVLAVGTINTNFNELPVPTLRYNNAADVYVLVFNVRAPDRWLAQREIWYDRTTLRPRRVMLYDANGRPVVRADLSLDKKVQVPDQNAGDWPLVAGDYKLFFPDSGSRMELSLKDVLLYRQVGRLRAPNPASFQRPDIQGTGIQSIQIGGVGGE